MCCGSVPSLSSHFLSETIAPPFLSAEERASQLMIVGGLPSAGTGTGSLGGRETQKGSK